MASSGYATLNNASTLNALTVGAATYSPGAVATISTSGSSTTVTGSAAAAFTPGMAGGTIYFVDNGGVYRNEYITAYVSATSITIGNAHTINCRHSICVVVYGGLKVSQFWRDRRAPSLPPKSPT